MTGRATETSAFRGSDFDDIGRIASSGGSNILILAGFGFEIMRKHPRNLVHRNQFVYTNQPYLSLHHGLAGPYYFSFCQTSEPGWPALRDVTFKLRCPQGRIAGLITLPILN
jgi:hypothetical protein